MFCSVFLVRREARRAAFPKINYFMRYEKMSKYTDMVVCDLRNIKTVEQAKAIEEISDVVLLLLPKDGDPELLAAIAAIPKSDVVSEIAVSADAEVRMINGIGEINDATAGNGESIFVVNGITILSGITKCAKISLIVNGIAFVNDNIADKIELNVISQNGLVFHSRFDDYKLFNNQCELDADFLSFLKPNTALIAGNKIKVMPDVTVDMLRDSNVQFIAGNSISCPKAVAGYVKANSTVGNKVEVDGEESGEDD